MKVVTMFGWLGGWLCWLLLNGFCHIQIDHHQQPDFFYPLSKCISQTHRDRQTDATLSLYIYTYHGINIHSIVLLLLLLTSRI